MRGKHGNAAAGRRDRAELEDRATTAERRADKAEKAHADLKVTTDRQIAGLRADLAAARKERDDAAAPAVAAAEQQIRALMAEREAAEDARKNIQSKWNAATSNIIRVLKQMGLTNVEAMETLLASIMPGEPVAHYIGDGKHKSVETTLAMDRARGHRHAVDPLSALSLPAQD